MTFEIGTDLDHAQVLVQNLVAVAEPHPPEEVRRQGITVKKQSTTIVIVVSLTSENDRYRSLFPSNYANLRMRGRTEPRGGRRRRARSSAAATTACGSGSTRRSSRPAT